MSKNDITGDKIQTKGILSEQGRDNWDAIFGKKKEHKIPEGYSEEELESIHQEKEKK